MKQIIFIGGGEVFDTREQYVTYIQKMSYDPNSTKKSWKGWISWALSDEYNIMIPDMPCKQNAEYAMWKIQFEKVFQYLNEDEIILVGHSLGTTFLIKYLQENTFPKNIYQLHLVAPYLSPSGPHEGMNDFTLDTSKLSTIGQQASNIYIYHSTDDPVVPFSQAQELSAALPSARFLQFKNRGHFNQPAFPELLQNIKNYSADRII